MKHEIICLMSLTKMCFYFILFLKLSNPKPVDRYFTTNCEDLSISQGQICWEWICKYDIWCIFTECIGRLDVHGCAFFKWSGMSCELAMAQLHIRHCHQNMASCISYTYCTCQTCDLPCTTPLYLWTCVLIIGLLFVMLCHKLRMNKKFQQI